MPNLPSYFEYLKSEGEPQNTGLYAFEYDEEYGLFMVADKKVHPIDFDPAGHVVTLDVAEVSANDPEIETTPLFLGIFNSLFSGPIFRDFVMSNPSAMSDVSRVMVDVYEEVLDEELDDDVKQPGGFLGFDSRFLPNGTVNLQVFGNCACIGVDLNSMYINAEDGMENGYAQYTVHNTDTHAQRTSIYAGMGHIARLASGRGYDQQRLF